MKQELKFIQNTKIIFRKEENGAYLYDPDSGNLKYINRVGTFLYELCDGLHLVEGMIFRIAREYQDVPMDQVEKDVDHFLADLLQMDFVKRIT
ncbi:MAG: PqqD family peptide modification chaperone [Deltaproteobacteria bacterium]|nr:PqqD family peptide modification chaperone [Deltaproteobacteria bacterium]